MLQQRRILFMKRVFLSYFGKLSNNRSSLLRLLVHVSRVENFLSELWSYRGSRWVSLQKYSSLTHLNSRGLAAPLFAPMHVVNIIMSSVNIIMSIPNHIDYLVRTQLRLCSNQFNSHPHKSD